MEIKLSCLHTNKDNDGIREIGIQLFNAGKYQEAIEVFCTLDLVNDQLARQYLARSYHRLEYYEIAYKHYKYLADNYVGTMRDYGISMTAAIEIVWGNYDDAINSIRTLPVTFNNRINLSILYWKKFSLTGEEFYLYEGYKILKNTDTNELSHTLKKIMYHMLALYNLSEQEYISATYYFKKAISLTVDNIARKRILIDYGLLLIKLKKYKKAEKLLKYISCQINGKSVIQSILNNKMLGLLYHHIGKTEEAKKYLYLALSGAREKGLVRDIADISVLIANIEYKGDLLRFCAEKYCCSEDLVKKHVVKKIVAKSDIQVVKETIWKKGVFAFENENYVEAIECFSYILGQSENVYARKYLAKCYIKLNLITKAKEHFSVLSTVKDHELKEYGNTMLALFEVNQGKIDKAIRRLLSLEKTSINILNLAVMYYKKYEQVKSEVYLWNGIKLLRKIDLFKESKNVIKNTYHIFGLLYQELKEYDTAKSFYHKAIECATDKISKVRIMNDLAILYSTMNKCQEARHVLLDIESDIKNYNGIHKGISKKLLGLLALKDNNFEEAKKYLEESAQILQDKHLIQCVAEVNYYLATVVKKDFMEKLLDEKFSKAVNYFSQGIFWENNMENVFEFDYMLDAIIEEHFFGE